MKDTELTDEDVLPQVVLCVPMRTLVLLTNQYNLCLPDLIQKNITGYTLAPILKKRINLPEAVRVAMDELFSSGNLFSPEPKDKIEKVTLHAARLGGSISDAVKEILVEQKIL